MQNFRVLRAGHAAALGLGVLDIVQNLLGDALAGCKDGDARGIAHDELAAHHALGLPQGQALFGGVEGLLRAGGHHGVDVFLTQQTRAVGAVAALDLGQCTDQTLHLLRTVADGQVGKDVADIAELDLNIVLIAQDIFETPEFGRVLTLDGNVMLTERDEFIYDEMIVHVPMAVHKEAKDILVIGAGDGGVVRELTRYDRVERIDLVEMDPQVVEACRAYLPGNACRMDDRRVHIYFENALKYIRRCEEEYDLIIVDSSDPFGPSEGLFTREFYGSCFNALKEDGIMVNQQGSPFYAEDASAMQRSHKRIASTFPISRVYQAHIPTFAAGYWLFGFASKKYHPIDDLDAESWKALNMRTRYYTTKLHIGAFYLPAFLEEMLREVEEH